MSTGHFIFAFFQHCAFIFVSSTAPVDPKWPARLLMRAAILRIRPILSAELVEASKDGGTRQKRIDCCTCSAIPQTKLRDFTPCANAPVAQLDRASDFGDRGEPFGSSRNSTKPVGLETIVENLTAHYSFHLDSELLSSSLRLLSFKTLPLIAFCFLLYSI